MVRQLLLGLGLLVTSCTSAPKTPPPPVGTMSWVSAKTPAPSSRASVAGASSAKAEAPQTFAFGWRVPCRVPVEHYVEKKGKAARFRYAVDVRSRPDGRLGVHFEDMELIEADGADVKSAEFQAALAQVMAAFTTSMPTLLVTPEGEYMGTEGHDAMVDTILSSKLYRTHAKSAAALKAVGKILRSPRVKAMMSAKMGDYWRTWVEAWIGLKLAPGEVLEGDDEIQVGEKKIPTRVRFEHHGPVEPSSKLVRVSLVSRMEGNKSAAGIELMLGMLQGAGFDVTKEIQVESFRRVARVSAETDPASLRPVLTRFETDTEMHMDGTVLRQREVREDRFDWAGAEGCM